VVQIILMFTVRLVDQFRSKWIEDETGSTPHRNVTRVFIVRKYAETMGEEIESIKFY